MITMNELNKIIKGGYCIGCGACASASGGAVKIIENDYLQYEAQITNEEFDFNKALDVCPFSNNGPNEDEISTSVFDKEKGCIDGVIGYYQSLFAGHAKSDKIRSNSTSGGIITWTLLKLLERNDIDAVIHIKKESKPGMIFKYGISKTEEELLAGAKSRYYPVEMSEVIDLIRNNNQRYAFVGLPCFTKALRKYALVDPAVNERVKFYIGLVCGHLKSKAFTEFVGWQAGLNPNEIVDIDFRYKFTDRSSDDYGIRVTDVNGKEKTLVARELLGTNWGLGYFKYIACDYCDDIFAETADLNIGDAWLNHYTIDSKGNSVIVSRNTHITNILKEGIESGELNFDELSAEEIKQSQGGGFRHRRSGLGYRLYLKNKNNEWAPDKRIKVNKNGLSTTRKLIFKSRVKIMLKSSEYWFKARKNNDYASFEKKMTRTSCFYNILLKTSSYLKRLK